MVPRGLVVALLAATLGVPSALACSAGRGTAGCRFDVLLLPSQRAFNGMKNRTALPAADDFDSAVTLSAVLTSGDDRERWSSARAARLEGYVVRVYDAGRESANCFSATRLDAHIEVAARLDAAPDQRVIVEVTPPMRDSAAARRVDWTTTTLQRELTGRRVEFEGWLLFDREHDGESANTAPRESKNWRATAWEIHPVTAIRVLSARD